MPVLKSRHLSALAIMAALVAIRIVPLGDISFFIFSIFYVLFLSKVAFPSTISSPEPPLFSPNEIRMLVRYVFFITIIALYLPIAYILEATVRGEKESVTAAASHLFLHSAQIFAEGLMFSGKVSLPAWVFVPVAYNTNRLHAIIHWLRSEFSKAEEVNGPAAAMWSLYVGRGLAIANMVLWSFNLFGFLVPVFLPRILKRYYSKVKT